MKSLFGAMAESKQLECPLEVYATQLAKEVATQEAICQGPKEFPILDKDVRIRRVNRGNKSCPYHKFVGQNNVFEQLLPLLNEAWQSKHRTMSTNALMFTGPPSVGKTDVAKATARGLGVPFAMRNAAEINSVAKVFELLEEVGEEAGSPLIHLGTEQGREMYQAQPTVMFWDELPGLSKSMMRSLLNMFEAKDHTLSTNGAVIDVQHVLWIGATTELGSIRKRDRAFDSRWMKIEFESYTLDEVSQIVQLNHSDWTTEQCRTLAIRSGRVPRGAITMGGHVDAKLDYLQLNDANVTRMDAIVRLAEEKGIDEHGMSQHQLTLLRALGGRCPRGMTLDEMAQVINREVDELKETVLPALRVNTVDHPACIAQPHRTHITRAGMDQLVLRNLMTEEEVEKLWS